MCVYVFFFGWFQAGEGKIQITTTQCLNSFAQSKSCPGCKERAVLLSCYVGRNFFAVFLFEQLAGAFQLRFGGLGAQPSRAM